MQVYGTASVSDFLQDFVIYRNLTPLDRRLPGLDTLRQRLELPAGRTPRKSERDYARVVAALLRKARHLDRPNLELKRLIFVGDTHLNDGNAFRNISQVGKWPGRAFIGADREAPPTLEEHQEGEQALFLGNRWSMLPELDWDADEQTAVVIDLDKTALGARGRNDHVIDRARVSAVRQTVGSVLGDSFSPEDFQQAYDTLNQLEYHSFTADNQDYLAYICLILGGGLMALEPLLGSVSAGEMANFEQFIAAVDTRAAELPAGLADIHHDVYGRVKQGDPTPFKAFRYNEFKATIACMGVLDDDAPVEELLAREIVVTREVQMMALKWREQGALLFGLSDKPDEASVPSEELAAQNYQSIHRVPTHVVGV